MHHDHTLIGYEESKESCEIHALSQPFTGAIIQTYRELLKITTKESRCHLVDAVVHVYATAFFTVRKESATFEGITLKIMKFVENSPRLGRAFGKSFLERGFLTIGPKQGLYVSQPAQDICKKPTGTQGQQRKASPKRKSMAKKKYVLVQ